MNKVLGLFFILAGAFIALMGVQVESESGGSGGGVHYLICAVSTIFGIWIMFPKRGN